MPTKRTVTVTRDGGTLVLDPALVELNSGDWVEWNFQGDLSGGLPVIKFDDSSAPFGPFQCLQSKPDGTVQGKGNVGTAGELAYTAMLLDTASAQASGTGSVRNLQQPKNTSPVVTVTVTETQEGPCLKFEPDTPLMLYPGDTALWNIFGLSPGHFISFLFEPPPQDSTLDPLVGPFESLLANRRVGEEEANVMRVIAANFKPKSNDISQYIYQVAVRNSSGEVLIQHEPVIDNLGQPPG